MDPENAEQVIKACHENDISHVFVGPEAPLSAGIVDELKKAGFPAIGPHKSAARLEGSKIFSKNFMNNHKIPTADAVEFNNEAKFESYIRSINGSAVIKKDGLAAGKGVLVSGDTEQLIAFGKEILKD